MDRLEIAVDDVLYRRIHPDHIHPQTRRVSSAAFVGDDAFNLSVELAALTTPQAVMDYAAKVGQDCFGVAAFTAGEAREIGFEVKHDPLPETDPDGPNPAHCLVIGEKEHPGRKPAKKLSRKCKSVWPTELLALNTD